MFKRISFSLLQLLLLTAFCGGLSFFSLHKTRGFELRKILSNLPDDPRWEVPPLSNFEQARIHRLLSQEFTFLGAGGWCYAFLGEDQETVLKFYKHTHLDFGNLFRNFHRGKFFLKAPEHPSNASYSQEFNFKSCTLLYENARELSNLLYVHLNKTEGIHSFVTLVDPSGIRHRIDLDKTEFVVQSRAELLIPYLEKHLHADNLDGAKIALDQFLEYLVALSQKGIRDHDRSLRKNYGFVGTRPVAFDVSSFGPDETLKHPEVYRKELKMKTHRLERWLRKHHPPLYEHYEKRIQEF